MIVMCLSIEHGNKKKREGAVLLMVLGMVLIASWIVVQIIGRVGDEIELRGVEDQNDAIRASAFQSLEIVMGVLEEIRLLDGALYSPAQGWGDPLGYAGFPRQATNSGSIANLDEYGDEEVDEQAATVQALDEIATFSFPPGIQVVVDIEDESGRLPLNATSKERWKMLFEEMEIQSSDAELLADTLLDWIDPDDEPRLNGAEAGTYQRRDPPYLPANGPIDDLHDLRLIEGFDRLFFDQHGLPNDRFRLFRECVTEVAGGSVNYNTVHPLVLAVLAEELDFEADKVSDFVRGPDLEPGTADDRVLRPDLDENEIPRDGDGEPLDLSAVCRYLTVRITSMSAGTAFRLSARLDTQTRPKDTVYPMEILDLQTKGADL
jgi:general secretion pathway protein K